MHSYLRTIGFSKIKTKSEQNKLISTILNNTTDRREIEISSDTTFIQINKSFGNGLGLSIVGEYDKDGYFNIDHSFPYCTGESKVVQSDIQIEPHSDKDAYYVISDDFNLGMTLIYNLQNISDYMKTSIKTLNEFKYSLLKNNCGFDSRRVHF